METANEAAKEDAKEETKQFKDYWERFAQRNVPRKASENQRATMRRCFYSGAVAAYAIFELASKANDNDNEDGETAAAAILAKLDQELTRFATEELLGVLLNTLCPRPEADAKGPAPA